MNPTFSAGTLPVWRHPIRLRRSLGNVDSLSGDYKCALSTTLNVGDAVPGYPGMVIMDLDETNSGISHEYSIQAEGSLDNSSPTKLLSRGESRSIGPTFETFSEQYLSWQTARKAITGVAATDVITSTAHGYSDTQKVVLLSLSGGDGLTSQSASAIGVIYYVRDATTDTFKLASTSGGSAIDFTTDITAGYVIDAQFCPGTVHPDWPAMYLTNVSLQDTNTPWRKADCQYVGMMWAKPYHRVITVNGQQFSSSEPITVDLSGGWPSTARYTNFILPEVVVTDTVVETSAPSTSSVPTINTPPNAPTIQSLTLSATNLTYNYPYGWSLVDVSNVETLNSGITVYINRKVWRYIWPVMFR